MAAAKRKNEKAQDATDKASCFSWHWLVVGVVAVLVPLCGLGIRDLANLSSRETTWKEHRAAVRLTSRDVSFDEYPATIKAESHRDVGLVYHPHAGGYLVQVQKPLPSNTSLLRIPYDAVLDAETACEVWSDFCTAVNSESQELAQALATGFKVTLSDDAKVRALGRLKLMAALLRLRWASVNQTMGRSKPIALSGNARRHLPWVKTVLMQDREVSTDMQLLPDVASKCLTGADRNSWITATSMLAAERRAIMRVITALKGADDELDISLDDVAWASAVIRRRSWLRPAPFFFALVPLVDLNDQRTGDGDKSALRLDRDVTATVAFDDASKRAHLVLSDNVTRGAYPIVRGDDDGAFPMMASSTVRRYGFFDNQSTALPSHASPLFADLDRSLNCHVDKALYFNATTASPSPLLRQCVEALTGKPNKVLKFLSFHAARAAKELYDPQSMFACESFVSKGKTSSKRAVEQAEMQLAAFHHTRQGLLEVARRLQAEP